MKRKEKIAEIKKAWIEGKIRKFADGSCSVPSDFFIKGITLRLINEVIK